MENAGEKAISRRRQRKGSTGTCKKNVHFQTVRSGGFEETQVICYLWDLVKLMEEEKKAALKTPDSGKLEKGIRSRIHIEMRRYFLRQRRRSVKMVAGILLIFLCTIGLFTCVVGVDRVRGDSMYPYLYSGDWIVYSRIGPPAARNDVVVFEKKGETLVKRVAGLPGDTVEISASGSQVVVNGIQLQEQYVTVPSSKTAAAGEDMGLPQTVMDGQYLVLGDNRSISVDSRDSNMGTVAAADIFGRVFLVVRSR